MIGVIALDGSFRREACERRQCSLSSECRDVIVQNLIGAGLGRAVRYNFDSIRILGRYALLLHQARDHFRHLGASMAGVAGQRLPSTEIGLVHCVHYANHGARHAFAGNVFGEPMQVLKTLGDVTTSAVQA